MGTEAARFTPRGLRHVLLAACNRRLQRFRVLGKGRNASYWPSAAFAASQQLTAIFHPLTAALHNQRCTVKRPQPLKAPFAIPQPTHLPFHTTRNQRLSHGSAPLTDAEQDRVALAIVEHPELSNWKIEEGPPLGGHGTNIQR